MIGIINWVIGTIILFIFILAVLSISCVSKKYKKMFSTMKDLDHDKNLLIIEREYRHGYLQDRVERIKLFVEKQYYEIKLLGIPLYAFEDFTISSVYFVVLLGITFTFILISLPSSSISSQMISVFFLSIEGLLLGVVLMVIRTLSGISEKREIFQVNLCNYLEHELELFDGVEKDEEDVSKVQEISEKNQADETRQESGAEADCRTLYGYNHIPASGENSEDIEISFDEKALMQVLEEILG
jgi:hypothetical protein